ncbi:MAG: sulfur carrier protein ThiS [Proteobacteria bacterium]|nr:sulfur carrier protein ThiS [Pseudomonadota bacterium]
MDIIVNGDSQSLKQNELTISSLLQIQSVEMPDMVSVQLNGEFIERDSYDSTKIKEKDEVDFLYFMGGGAI